MNVFAVWAQCANNNKARWSQRGVKCLQPVGLILSPFSYKWICWSHQQHFKEVTDGWQQQPSSKRYFFLARVCCSQKITAFLIGVDHLFKWVVLYYSTSTGTSARSVGCWTQGIHCKICPCTVTVPKGHSKGLCPDLGHLQVGRSLSQSTAWKSKGRTEVEQTRGRM